MVNKYYSYYSSTMAAEEQKKTAQSDRTLPDGLPKPAFYLKDVPICFSNEKKKQSHMDVLDMEFNSDDVIIGGYMRSGKRF